MLFLAQGALETGSEFAQSDELRGRALANCIGLATGIGLNSKGFFVQN
jgi:hypothetical protein